MITKLDQIANWAKNKGKRWKVAVVLAEDSNSITALLRAYSDGFITPILIGNKTEIAILLKSEGFDICNFSAHDCIDVEAAAALGVKLVKDGNADILMKGLIGTDKFLKAVLNKQDGLMLPNGIMSYVGILQAPKYHKLIVFTDPAVIPFPDITQKCAMLIYSLIMSRSLGVTLPKVSLISAVEKPNSKIFPSHEDYEKILELYRDGEFGDCIIDGPLDLFLSIDKNSVAIKKVETPINGDADILLFPNIESSNPFYKSLMFFGDGELAGLIQGTTHPVIVMSRSESANSKYFCIALACLMAEKA